MYTKADWLVVLGFLIALFGVALRIILMMRASDARPANATLLPGNALLRDFRTVNPHSKMPLVMWASLSTGLVLLIAGFLLELR
jgi:hypothetical protein